MDPAPLVTDEIEAGSAFLRELNRIRPVIAVCWLREDEESDRYRSVTSTAEPARRSMMLTTTSASPLPRKTCYKKRACPFRFSPHIETNRILRKIDSEKAHCKCHGVDGTGQDVAENFVQCQLDVF